MTAYLQIAACALLLASCGGATRNVATETTATDSLAATALPGEPLDVQPLTGYFLKNTIQVTDSLTFWVINNAVTFDSLFAPAKTMGNPVSTPDFGTRLVVAATMPVTDNGTLVQLQNAYQQSGNGKAELHFIAIAGEKKTYRISPLWLGTLPKSGLKSIDFYNGNKLALSSPLTQ